MHNQRRHALRPTVWVGAVQLQLESLERSRVCLEFYDLRKLAAGFLPMSRCGQRQPAEPQEFHGDDDKRAQRSERRRAHPRQQKCSACAQCGGVAGRSARPRAVDPTGPRTRRGTLIESVVDGLRERTLYTLCAERSSMPRLYRMTHTCSSCTSSPARPSSSTALRAATLSYSHTRTLHVSLAMAHTIKCHGHGATRARR